LQFACPAPNDILDNGGQSRDRVDAAEEAFISGVIVVETVLIFGKDL